MYKSHTRDMWIRHMMILIATRIFLSASSFLLKTSSGRLQSFDVFEMMNNSYVSIYHKKRQKFIAKKRYSWFNLNNNSDNKSNIRKWKSQDAIDLETEKKVAREALNISCYKASIKRAKVRNPINLFS